MDLFEAFDQSSESKSHLPLAERMRPADLAGVVGQSKLLGQGSPWRQLFETGQIPSLILWGPPGTGKTTLARILIKKAKATEISINAVDTGAKALREIGESARQRRRERREKTIVFIDEIHRLNKSQQDVLLPFVEGGDLSLIGATTENPSYELNSALLSRCRVLVFQRLEAADLEKLFRKTMHENHIDSDRFLTPEAKNLLLDLADGDGRKLLNAIETLTPLFHQYLPSRADESAPRVSAFEQGAIESTDSQVSFPLRASDLLKCLETSTLNYDKDSDQHHDTISAFIKSVRGSDPDAAIYYLARMVRAGEDPVFIARRLVILASEDIGNADPRGLLMATAGLQAVELVGWPEAAINLAQVTTYLASAPKSNRAYSALNLALEVVDKQGSLPIPLSLRSAKTALAKQLGYGAGYKYSHDGAKGFVPQTFLPDQIANRKFYEPANIGFEKTIREFLNWLKQT